jgi:hypothetical protein
MAAESDGVDEDVYREFKELVNLPPAELEKFLGTDESREVGWAGEGTKSSPGGPESVGHKSGTRIVSLLRTKKADLSADDEAHMRKVVGYVKRHLAQGPPKDDVEHSRWRYSLMNWGHDPLKD